MTTGTGIFFLFAGLLLVGVAIYFWLFDREKGASNPLDAADAQQDKVDSEAGTVENYFKGRQVKSQTEFQRVVTDAKQAAAETIRTDTEVASAQLEKEALPERHDQTLKKDKAQTQTELARLESERVELSVRNQLMGIALSQEMDVTTYLQVTSHRNLKQIDLEARDTDYKQDQEQISKVQQEKLELIDRASHRLYSMYEERKRLEASDDPAKEDKLTHLNKLIQGGEVLILGEQDRFIQSTLGQEAPRSLSAHDSGTGDSSETEADQI